ncbi:hypothetical protein EVJ58_g1758 [Rhodofomes roseus]|uniref:HTH CENPB-type domain-containing protein n=1 Tax=Rhodofomes roseus TaxID=34475 RepID=A0A4Y9YZZ4_9APHY|nr:hypothetical protein EVJ58_g1758 [Rhodofomes roseus]
MKIAIERYLAEQEKPNSDVDLRRKGARAICTEVEAECYETTNCHVKLSRSTLLRLAKGGRSITDFNAEKSWLNADETEAIISYAVELAKRGFPLSHRRIREHAEEIIRGRQGDALPESGLGKRWSDRFVEKHSDRLKAFWSHALDTSRARAVNPHTKEAYFDILEKEIIGKEEEDSIVPECIYGTDETGIQSGVGTTERVFGPAGKSVQQQQRSGGRENITVIVTICGDGTSLPPAVIFKGECFQSSWKQNNPLDATLGYSKKGYTDGEIGVAWIEDFDKRTKEKAAGRRRLLLVDGHNSHYTRAFLEYARLHTISVICYPSHSTHIYQGLDVIIFSVLKRCWTDERDGFERRSAQKVSKTNFLAIYAAAHVRALTSANILSAFRTTGVIPVNRDVITEDDMAPSLETSIEAALPFMPSTPVRAITERLLLRMAAPSQAEADEPEAGPSAFVGSYASDPRRTPSPTSSEIALCDLANTQFGYLIHNSPLRSTRPPPTHTTLEISPPRKRRYAALLEDDPRTEREQELQVALRESNARNENNKKRVSGMQAKSVLSNMYMRQSRSQLQAQEEEKGKKKSTRILNDGGPRLLTSDGVFNIVEAHDQTAEQKKRDKLSRKEAREAHGAVIAAWKAAEAGRLKRNIARRQDHKEAVAAWETDRDKAKRDKQKFTVTKPKVNLESPVPRPKKVEDSDEEDDEEQDGDAEHGSMIEED